MKASSTRTRFGLNSREVRTMLAQCMKTQLAISVLSVSALVMLAACSSPRPEPKPGTISINMGGLGPNIEIGGIDNDDDTPATVRIH